MRRSGLGKGLAALLPEVAGEGEGAAVEIPVQAVRPNPYQPRQRWPEENLAELCESIRRYGVLQPILVRPVAGGYELVAGERRWRACQQLGLERIPAVVRDLDEAEVLLLALVENLQREDINAIEAAQAYQTAIQQFGLTQVELAQHLGKSRSSIANTLRLMGLQEAIRQSIAEGLVSEGHGRALLAIEDEGQRLAVWRRIVTEGLTVRQVERLSQTGSPARRERARPEQTGRALREPHLQSLVDRLQRAVGTEVSLKERGEGGVVSLRYYHGEDLERLIELCEAGAAALRRKRGRSTGLV